MSGERTTTSSADDALKDYHATVAWLEGFIRPITGTSPQRTPVDWLAQASERFAPLEALLERLGHPERRYRSLHVTGTSGKGSVCTYLGAVLGAAGFKVGVHTTPYLQVPVEKLQVEGRYISPGAFAQLVAEFREVVSDGFADLPYPALSLALTYLYFAKREIDVAVIESSVGGRFDWTNTIRPVVSIITTVGPDHLSTLGPTLDDVAFHKAGIIKPGVPSVTGVDLPYRLAIEREAAGSGSPLQRLGEEFFVEVTACTEYGTRFDFISATARLVGLETGMVGRHQAFNAGLAVAALHSLKLDGRGVTEEAIRQGLRSAHLAGRMELIQRSPDVILDGAHNPEKAAALASSLAELFPDRRLVLVVGTLSSKDVGGILKPFRSQARLAIVTAPHVLGKTGLDPALLASASNAAGIDAVVETDSRVAVRRALECAGPDDVICVTGSLYLVGEVRSLWVPDDAVLTTGLSTPAAVRAVTSA